MWAWRPSLQYKTIGGFCCCTFIFQHWMCPWTTKSKAEKKIVHLLSLKIEKNMSYKKKQKPDLTHSVQSHTKWKAHKLCSRQLEFTMCNLYPSLIKNDFQCNSRRSQPSWGPSSQTAKHWKHSCSFVTKTYGTDQDCVSVLNHSDRPNEFPRSTECLFVLFSGRGLEFLSKSLQQWSVWKWSASFETKVDGGYSVCTSL